MLLQGMINTAQPDPNCANQPSESKGQTKNQRQQRPRKPKAPASSAAASTSLAVPSTQPAPDSLAPPEQQRGASEGGGYCLLCWNPIIYHVTANCAHAAEICGTCTMRMKVFPIKKIDRATGQQEPFAWTCPFCKSLWDRVQISASSTAPLSLIHDREVDIFFDLESTVGVFKKIRACYCTACPPEKQQERSWFATVRALESHLDRVHQLYFCVACLETQSVFTQDRRLYTKAQLTDHYKNGTPANGDQAPIAPHPFCGFCSTPYYSEDELYVHQTTRHKQCKFCPPPAKFFRDSRKMYEHYSTAHFVCQYPECNLNLDDVAAFRDQLDMKAHELQIHTDRKNMSRAELKALTTLSLGFNTSSVGNDYRGGRRNNNSSNNQREVKEDEIVIPETFEESYPTLGNSIADRAQAANGNLHLMSNRERQETQQLIDSISAVPVPVVPAPARTAVPTPQWRPAPPSDEFPSLPGAKPKKDDKKKWKGASKVTTVAPKTAMMKSAPMIPKSSEPRAESAFPSLITFKNKRPAKPAAAAEPVKSEPVSPKDVTVETKEAPRKPLAVPSPCPIPCSDSEVHAENTALMARVRVLVNNDPTKVKQFREGAASYQSGRVSAKEYYQTFQDMLGDSTKDVALLLLRLIPEEKKRKELHAEYVRHFYDTVFNKSKSVVVHTAGSDSDDSPSPTSAPSSSLSTSFSAMATIERNNSSGSVGDSSSSKKPPSLDESFGPPLSKKTPATLRATEDSGSLIPKKPPALDDSFGPPLASAKSTSTSQPPGFARPENPTRKASEEVKATGGPLRLDDSFGPPLVSSRKVPALPPPGRAEQYLAKLATPSSLPASVVKDLEFLSMVLVQVGTELAERVGDVVSTRGYQCSGDKKEQLKQVANQVRVVHAANFSPVYKFGMSPSTQTALTRITSLHQADNTEGLGVGVPQALLQMTPVELYLLYEYLHLIVVRFLPSESNASDNPTQQTSQQSKQAKFWTSQFGEDNMVPLKQTEDAKAKTETTPAPAKKGKKKFQPLYLD